MLSQALRTTSEAKPLQAAWLSCGHSLPCRGYLIPSDTTGADSRFENVEGLP
jgi:hypothetical protein